MQSLELLSPAGSADIGIAAIDHGADAVYIGAPRFSGIAVVDKHRQAIRLKLLGRRRVEKGVLFERHCQRQRDS